MKYWILILGLMGCTALWGQSLSYGPYAKPRSPQGLPGHDYWQNRADYQLEVQLHPEQRQVSGRATITYTNNSPDPLSFLWLKLDGNLFASGSRGNRATETDEERHGSKGTGGLEIQAVEGATLGEHRVEDTRMQIDLDTALPGKGGQMTFSVDFTYTLPEYGSDRTGWTEIDDGLLFSVAQWYPRMAVLDDRRGWNILPYLGGGEFYGDPGHFDVRITAPADYLVMASGTLENPEAVLSPAVLQRYRQAQQSEQPTMILPEEEAGSLRSAEATRTWHYRLANTRDVAWIAGNRLMWDAALVTTASGDTVFCQSVYPPSLSGREAFGRATEYMQACIAHYAEKWAPFPFPTMVCAASHVGGIEYPGLTFVPFERRENALWRTLDHEVAHNYFPMWVNSNERAEAWMDEGLVTFMGYYSARAFPPFQSYLSNLEGMRQRLATNPQLAGTTEPDRYHGPGFYEAMYFRPAYALIVLREYVLGPDRFDRGFRTYLNAWGGKHPGPADLFRCLENAGGEQLDWFWQDWFFSNAKLDLRLEGVGLSDDEHSLQLKLYNAGAMRLPVDLAVTLDDGTTLVHRIPVEVWLRQDHFQWTWALPGKPVQLRVDPNGWLPDQDRSDFEFTF